MFKKILSFLTGSSETKSKCECESCNNGEGSLNDLESFVEYVIKALVDFPDEVVLNTVKTDDGTTIQVRCRKEDIGKIVGKHGKTIMAIRSLVSGAAGRQRKRVSVDVLD